VVRVLDPDRSRPLGRRCRPGGSGAGSGFRRAERAVGNGGPGSSLTLLGLLAALATAVRAWKPPFLSSIVPRAVPMLGTALALSVERPG